ncbi:MAG TPA: hypothetical protein DIS76_06080, partial [Rhodospirillaceae bacterium]|nr:hypothetical protein [Rhodospirillaceae bacterium]
MHYFQNAQGEFRPWHTMLMVAGFILVFALWFGTRVYTYHTYQRADNPSKHPMTEIYHDMAISMDEGRPLGEVNISRIMRNKDAKSSEPYPADPQPTDEYRQFQTLDPGYGVVFWAARHIFYFIPDTVQRPLMLQLFLDAVVLFALYFTFYRWGWFPAVTAGVLYSSNIIFAYGAATPWYHFWDGLICTVALLRLLWLYRAARSEDPSRLFLILSAIGIGVVLGAGVWIRSSWFVFSPILLFACLFSKTLRPWLIYAVLAYALFAGGMVLRATTLSGELSYSTRMSWHTAFQGLGRHPNPYGFEDNDLYLFARAHDTQGVDYNLGNYAAQDDAMKKDFLQLWEKDSGFVVQSISQRIFSNIFFNFNDKQQSFWNQGMLFVAFAGLLFGVWLAGEFALMAILSAIMFGAINSSYAFVYYITREYAFATQMLLLFGAVTAVAGMVEVVRRLWAKEWLNFRDTQLNPALVIMVAAAFGLLVIMMPPVQNYLAPNETMSVKWDSPQGIEVMGLIGLQNQVDELPEKVRKELLSFMKSVTTKKTPGPDDTVFQFAMQHLRQVTFTNSDGKPGIFWIHQSTDKIGRASCRGRG